MFLLGPFHRCPLQSRPPIACPAWASNAAIARAAAWELVPRLGDALDHADGMDALRTALAHVRPTGDDVADALAAIATAPVVVAAWSRRRAGEEPLPVGEAASHAWSEIETLVRERCAVARAFVTRCRALRFCVVG